MGQFIVVMRDTGSTSPNLYNPFIVDVDHELGQTQRKHSHAYRTMSTESLAMSTIAETLSNPPQSQWHMIA